MSSWITGRLGLTLGEIAHVVALRRAGTPPCAHVRRLLEQKVADLTGLLGELRRTLRSWRTGDSLAAAVCPHIERKGGDPRWRGSPSLSPSCTACPEVVIEGDTVRIGEDGNTAVLKKSEWNVLVDAITSGQLGRL